MNTIALLIILTCITGIGSGIIGGIIGASFNVESNKAMSLVMSFAAGLMLAIICFDFIPEAIELRDETAHTIIVVVVVALGCVIVALLNKIMQSHMEKKTHCCAIDDPELSKIIDDNIKKEHLKKHIEQENRNLTKEDDEHSSLISHSHGLVYEEQSQNTLVLAGTIMAIAIALHNLPAGMSIGASFAASDGKLISSGVMIAVLIGIHSIPESMAMVVPLRYSGASKTKVILISGLVGAVVVIGACLGFGLGEINEYWLAIALSFASGAMLFVLFGEMIPEAYQLYHSKIPAFTVIFGLLVGIILIAL